MDIGQEVILEGKFSFLTPKGAHPIPKTIRDLPISLFDGLHFVKGQDPCHKNNENGLTPLPPQTHTFDYKVIIRRVQLRKTGRLIIIYRSIEVRFIAMQSRHVNPIFTHITRKHMSCMFEGASRFQTYRRKIRQSPHPMPCYCLQQLTGEKHWCLTQIICLFGKFNQCEATKTAAVFFPHQLYLFVLFLFIFLLTRFSAARRDTRVRTGNYK